ncbi:MAG TPA: hypothetical protein VGL19_11265 [Polyangiaceae bacterium]
MLKLVTCASFVAAIAAGGDAAATMMTTPPTACGYEVDNNWQIPAGSPPWQLTRTSNGGISNPDFNGHNIACAIPRGNATSNALSFFLDGNNTVAGSATDCTIFRYNFLGTLRDSVSTHLTATSYDASLSLPAGASFDYLTLVCSMQGSNRTTLRGIELTE